MSLFPFAISISYPFQSVVYVSGLGNYEPKQETLRIGPGEGGKPHRLSSGKENEAGQAMSEYGMNMACSDEISLDRTIPDLRLEEYVNLVYTTIASNSLISNCIFGHKV